MIPLIGTLLDSLKALKDAKDLSSSPSQDARNVARRQSDAARLQRIVGGLSESSLDRILFDSYANKRLRESELKPIDDLFLEVGYESIPALPEGPGVKLRLARVSQQLMRMIHKPRPRMNEAAKFHDDKVQVAFELFLVSLAAWAEHCGSVFFPIGTGDVTSLYPEFSTPERHREAKRVAALAKRVLPSYRRFIAVGRKRLE